eukprot:scaffold2983_cov53-Attheya_sp.AAC.6
MLQVEPLLDLADALAQEENPCPSIPLPEGWQKQTTHDLMEIKDDDETNKGRGWYAKHDLSAGTVLLVEKPLAMVMAWEDDDDDDDEDDDESFQEEDESGPSGRKRNGLLVLRLLKQMQGDPAIWFDTLSQLFPRTSEEALSLPPWMCRDASVGMEMERAYTALAKKWKKRSSMKKQDVSVQVEQIKLRLSLIVRYNCLSVETGPELLSHPSATTGHTALSGTALYNLSSFFNHHHKPTASRWAIGDIIFFVANQNIPKGQQVCISYIEHEVLCESAERRSGLLNMDFIDMDDATDSMDETNEISCSDDHDAEDGPVDPVIDSEVQTELMQMPPLERLESIDELLKQSKGESVPTDKDDDHDDTMEQVDDDAMQWFQCDTMNLELLKALTLDGMGQYEEALHHWNECIAFARRALPPADEMTVVFFVQAALCAQCSPGGIRQESLAKEYAKLALEMHCILFGGCDVTDHNAGLSLFKRRYREELKLPLRQNSPSMDALWPPMS